MPNTNRNLPHDPPYYLINDTTRTIAAIFSIPPPVDVQPRSIIIIHAVRYYVLPSTDVPRYWNLKIGTHFDVKTYEKLLAQQL